MSEHWNQATRALGAALALVVTVSAPPHAAFACEPEGPCSAFREFRPAVDTVVLPDGLITFLTSRFTHAIATMEEALDYVSVDVFDASGEPLTGTLRWLDWADLVVWTPDRSFTPNEVVQVHVQVDNRALRYAFDPGAPGSRPYPYCGNDYADIDELHEFTVDSRTLDSLMVEAFWSRVRVTREVLDDPSVYSLDFLACCDGARPYRLLCGAAGFAYWDEGHCDLTAELARLSIRWELDWPPRSRGFHRNYRATFTFERGEGAFYHGGFAQGGGLYTEEPVCGTFALVRLIDNTPVVTERGCWGEGIEEPLGWVPREPERLAHVCGGEPYVCAHDGEQWTADECWPHSADALEFPTVQPSTGTEGDAGCRQLVTASGKAPHPLPILAIFLVIMGPYRRLRRQRVIGERTSHSDCGE